MDAAAQRALLFGGVRSTRADVVSSLLADDAAYVQRFALTTDCGEETVLTLRMSLEERLAPDYKSARIFEQWAGVHTYNLKRVRCPFMSVTPPLRLARLCFIPHHQNSPKSRVHSRTNLSSIHQTACTYLT